MRNLLPAGYLLMERGTYDLTEGHMVHFVSYDIKFVFPQCMETVIIIAIQNDDQEEGKMKSHLSVDIEEEKMKSHLSVDISTISSASFGSYEDFYSDFGFYFNIFGSLCKFMKVFLQTFDARNILQVLKLLFFEVLFTRYRNLFNVIW